MTTARPILLATDGSPSAELAQRTAFELAQRLDAPLLVVSVSNPALPAVGYSAYGYSTVLAELTQAENRRIETLLSAIESAAEEEGLHCSTVVADGFVAEEICRKAADYDAQLIVVGSHGWGPAHRFFSGSVSTALVHTAPCPVLVVRTPHQSQAHAAAA